MFWVVETEMHLNSKCSVPLNWTCLLKRPCGSPRLERSVAVILKMYVRSKILLPKPTSHKRRHNDIVGSRVTGFAGSSLILVFAAN